MRTLSPCWGFRLGAAQREGNLLWDTGRFVVLGLSYRLLGFGIESREGIRYWKVFSVLDSLLLVASVSCDHPMDLVLWSSNAIFRLVHLLEILKISKQNESSDFNCFMLDLYCLSSLKIDLD